MVQNTPNEAANVAVPQSENLTKLQSEKVAEFQKGRNISDPDSPEYAEHTMQMYQIGQKIKAELANIKKTEQDAKTAEMKNARLQLRVTLLAAHVAHLVAQNDKKLPQADKDAATAAFQSASDAIDNELLARFSASAPSKKTLSDPTKPASAPKGSTSLAIREKFIANRTAGMDNTENVKSIIADGFSRGTTGAVVLAYRREIGEAE